MSLDVILTTPYDLINLRNYKMLTKSINILERIRKLILCDNHKFYIFEKLKNNYFHYIKFENLIIWQHWLNVINLDNNDFCIDNCNTF